MCSSKNCAKDELLMPQGFFCPEKHPCADICLLEIKFWSKFSPGFLISWKFFIQVGPFLVLHATLILFIFHWLVWYQKLVSHPQIQYTIYIFRRRHRWLWRVMVGSVWPASKLTGALPDAKKPASCAFVCIVCRLQFQRLRYKLCCPHTRPSLLASMQNLRAKVTAAQMTISTSVVTNWLPHAAFLAQRVRLYNS